MGTQQGCCRDKSCNENTCMNLPTDRTCGDCLHFKRCEGLVGSKPTNTTCDFFPRSFSDRGEVRALPTVQKSVVVGIERFRRCCEADYQCPCGQRVTVYWHDVPRDAAKVVHCTGCGRPHRFETGKSPLPLMPKKAAPGAAP